MRTFRFESLGWGFEPPANADVGDGYTGSGETEMDAAEDAVEQMCGGVELSDADMEELDRVLDESELDDENTATDLLAKEEELDDSEVEDMEEFPLFFVTVSLQEDGKAVANNGRTTLPQVYQDMEYVMDVVNSHDKMREGGLRKDPRWTAEVRFEFVTDELRYTDRPMLAPFARAIKKGAIPMQTVAVAGDEGFDVLGMERKGVVVMPYAQALMAASDMDDGRWRIVEIKQ